MRSLFICTSVAAALAGADHATAGAWTQPEGQAQAIATLAYSFAVDAFDQDGRAVAVEPFEKLEARLYAEYGLSDWATIAVQPVIRRKEQGAEMVSGLGRLDLGLRTRLWRDDFSIVSVEGAISAPGASDELAPLNGGDTDWEIDARVLYGRGFSLGWRQGFADVQAGYRFRFDEPADELRLDMTVGLDVTEQSFAMVQSFNRLSVGAARFPFTETQEHAVALSTVYRLNGNWSLQAGTQVTAYGRNVLREQGFFISLWQKL